MERSLFYRLGKLINSYQWLIVILFLVLVIVCLPLAPKIMGPFKTSGFADSHSESFATIKKINQDLGYGDNQIIIVYTSATLAATDPKFIDEIKYSLNDLTQIPIEHQIIYPDLSQISPDQHTAYATVLLKGNLEIDAKELAKILAKIKQPPHLTMLLGGGPVFAQESQEITRNDLVRADYFALPLALIVMLIVFRSVVAAIIPMVLGTIGLLFTLITLFLLGHILQLSVFSLNVAALLGLGLNLNYSLLLISRFREELDQGQLTSDAIATTLNTAGKAISFSALAVIISLSALLLFHVNILVSVGIGGIVAVLSSVMIAIFLLPAILSILKTRINLVPIRFLPRLKSSNKSLWRWLIEKIVKQPLIYFIIIILFILVLSSPLRHLKLSLGDARILPKGTASHQVFDIFQQKFSIDELPILVMVQTPQGNILSPANIYYLYDFAHEIAKDPRVKRIDSIVTAEPRLTKNQFQELYTYPESLMDIFVLNYLHLTTHKDITVLTIMSKYPANSPQTLALVQKIRNSNPGNGMTLKVGGFSATLTDIFSNITHTLPYAILWIMVFTYLILLVLFRSLFLPLKAILMNIMSLSASYGVLVFVFQDGHFHHLLNFQPLGYLEVTSLIMILCVLFGISMDYEVFMLTRIKEYYEQSKDNTSSIIAGTEHSSRIITSAALVLILICISFLSADIVLIKALGLGIAVAIFVDAFLIRIFLVPATMFLFEKWNWYLPDWLDKILPKISFSSHDKTVHH